MKNLKRINLLISFILLSGCSYHWQPTFPYGTRPTITVPFVSGDEDGTLTAQIIDSLSESGLVDVVSFGGDYELRVSIVGEGDDKIGFRVDPQKIKGKVRKTLLSSEGRRTMSIEAALYTGEEIAYGPYKLSAEAEYDYVDGDSIQDLTFINPAGEVVTVLPFSLGQLESVESAKQASAKPLYRGLAQKIVDLISSEW